jgi:O-methyltransferase involved in polyketide biosynthesis
MYQEPVVLDYVRSLDLSSADDLWGDCYRVCPWYGEVILNRKHHIRSRVEEWLLSDPHNRQVVILGAGMDPLSLSLLQCHSSCLVFEIDQADSATKLDICSKLSIDVGRLHGIRSDVCSPELIDRLTKDGLRPEGPTYVVLEGISYYLRRQELERVLLRIKELGNVTVILEYLVPTNQVSPRSRRIPEKVFGAIARRCGVRAIKRYAHDDASALIKTLDGKELGQWDMKDMEVERRGENSYFVEGPDGWIECVEFQL